MHSELKRAHETESVDSLAIRIVVEDPQTGLLPPQNYETGFIEPMLKMAEPKANVPVPEPEIETVEQPAAPKSTGSMPTIDEDTSKIYMRNLRWKPL